MGREGPPACQERASGSSISKGNGEKGLWFQEGGADWN